MYVILAVLAVVFIYTTRRRTVLEKQVKLFNRLLYIEKTPEKYVAEVDKLLLKTQSEKERNINLIQKTTGLFYMGKFKEAIDILQKEVTKIPPNWQVIYYHNLLLCLYFNNEVDKANEVLQEAKDILDVYYKKDFNKVSIELIYAVSQFYNNNIADCKEFFHNLIEVARNDYRVAFGYYFTGKIQEAEGKIEDAEESLEQAKSYGHGSFIETL